jgi:hypothetical protein
MSSRTAPPSTNVIKTHPIGTPDIITQAVSIKAVSSDAFEFWGDSAIWDTTTGLPVSIDKFAITGTPRKRA